MQTDPEPMPPDEISHFKNIYHVSIITAIIWSICLFMALFLIYKVYIVIKYNDKILLGMIIFMNITIVSNILLESVGAHAA